MSRRPWYGRPNKPPENWHTPDRPAIRRVSGSPDDEDRTPDLAQLSPPDNPAGIAVSLTNEHWTAILKMLFLYGKAYGDADWRAWWMKIRQAVLGRINPNLDKSKPVAVRLALEDWRRVWRHVGQICREQGGDWQRWFEWLSQTMTEQIKNGDADSESG